MLTEHSVITSNYRYLWQSRHIAALDILSSYRVNKNSQVMEGTFHSGYIDLTHSVYLYDYLYSRTICTQQYPIQTFIRRRYCIGKVQLVTSLDGIPIMLPVWTKLNKRTNISKTFSKQCVSNNNCTLIWLCLMSKVILSSDDKNINKMVNFEIE